MNEEMKKEKIIEEIKENFGAWEYCRDELRPEGHHQTWWIINYFTDNINKVINKYKFLAFGTNGTTGNQKAMILQHKKSKKCYTFLQEYIDCPVVEEIELFSFFKVKEFLQHEYFTSFDLQINNYIGDDELESSILHKFYQNINDEQYFKKALDYNPYYFLECEPSESLALSKKSIKDLNVIIKELSELGLQYLFKTNCVEILSPSYISLKKFLEMHPSMTECNYNMNIIEEYFENGFFTIRKIITRNY